LSNLGLGLESMSPTKMCKIINDYEIVFQTWLLGIDDVHTSQRIISKGLNVCELETANGLDITNDTSVDCRVQQNQCDRDTNAKLRRWRHKFGVK
jgi:hypothetical protein